MTAYGEAMCDDDMAMWLLILLNYLLLNNIYLFIYYF